jgi:hypothetical protein
MKNYFIIFNHNMLSKEKITRCVMRNIVFVLFIFSVFVFSTFAEEIFTYKDKDGNTVISNTPVPEKYEKKAKKIEAYEKASPEEIEKEQKKASKRKTMYVYPAVQVNIINKRQPPAKKVMSESCKRECSVNLHLCQSDCSTCGRSCMMSYEYCLNRCLN